MSSNSPVIYKIKELNPDMIMPTTELMNDPEKGGSKTIVIGKPGCFTAGTQIMMYNGDFKNVEDVKVGEQIMGDDSTVRNVIELCHNEDEMFEIIPVKGEKYTVNKQHKLVLMSTGYNNTYKKNDIIEITVEEFLKKSITYQKRMKIFRTGVNFEHKNVLIDPYLLGLWLSDGTSSTTEFTTADTEIKEYLEQYCIDNNQILSNKSVNTKIQYRISSHEKTKGKNVLLNNLKTYNLINNKHIPKDYKNNSREIRLQILAGMLDTDGSYSKKDNCYDFILKNETLFDDFIFIARSLGFSAYKKKTQKSCIVNGEKVYGTYYRCTVSGKVNEIPCKIFRKQAKARKINKNNLVSGFKVRSVGYGEYYGFTLDGNHRFLLSTFDVVRNTGKSTLIASLLYAKKHIFPVAIAFSGSEDSNGFYRKLLPSSFVYNDYDEEAIKNFVRRQKIAKQHLENPWAVILIDDCTDDPRVFNTPLQQGMYKRGRHWKMWYILSLQYSMDVKPVIRTNVDNVFILREPILKNRKSLWENYASIIPDFTLFCQILDQITDDYTALYIHNQTRSNDWRDCVFWYKAPLTPEGWKFGSPEYHDFHNQRYNQDYIDPFDRV